MSTSDASPAASAAKAHGHDALRAFLSGKRRSHRKTARLCVELHGDGERLVGRTIDVSEGGILVRIPDDDAETPVEARSMLETMRLLEERFKTGVVARFPTLGIQVPGTPVRLAARPDDDSGLLLGFRFDRALSTIEAAKLFPGAAVPSRPLSSVTMPDAVLDAHVFVAGQTGAEPTLTGRVAALEGTTLDLRAQTSPAVPDADAATARLRDRAARLRVSEAGKVVWEGAIRVVRAADPEDGLGGLEVRVEAEEMLPQSLTGRFRPRA